MVENGEVVARKANVMPGYIVLLVFAVLLAVLGFVVGDGETGVLVFCLVIAGIFAVFAGVSIVLYIKKPKELIVYADGKLYLPKGVVCEPNEITHVLLKLTRSRYGVVSSTGSMVLTIGGNKITVNGVANVKDAEQHLSDICNRAAQQAAMAEAEAAHNFAPAGAEVVPTEPAAQAEPTEATTDTKKDDDPFGI